MKITLNNKEEIELTEREEMIWNKAYNEGGWFACKFTLTAVIIFILMLKSCTPISAQSTKTVYRQTLIIKNNKPISITWQKVTVNYLDVIYQYDRKLEKRRKALIIFGKEGMSPLSDWVKYDPKENDTIYTYKRELCKYKSRLPKPVAMRK